MNQLTENICNIIWIKKASNIFYVEVRMIVSGAYLTVDHKDLKPNETFTFSATEGKYKMSGTVKTNFTTQKVEIQQLRTEVDGDVFIIDNNPTPPPDPGPIFPTEDLEFYWNFDETSGDLLDQVGSNDGTVNGATQGATGKINEAYSFNGSSNYIEFESDTVDLGTIDFSVSVWINFSGSGIRVIFSKTDFFNGFLFFVNADSGITARVSGSNSTVDTESSAIGSGWHHIVFTADRDGNGTLYIDGEEDGTFDISGTGSIAIGTNSFIGVVNNDFQIGWFNGLIDELGIWYRLLDTDEIAALYNDGDGLAYEPA